MELTPLLIYESFILVIGAAAISAFAVFYFRLLRGYNALRLDHEKLEKEMDEYGNVIAASSKDHIAKLVAHSKELSEDLKNELTKLLAAQAEKESGAYEAVVRDVGAELEKESREQVQEFAASLQKEVSESEEEIRGRINALYDSATADVEKIRVDARAEMEGMKEAARNELKEKIYAIVADVVSETTGKMLSKEDSQGLVLAALEEAMGKQGIGESAQATGNRLQA